MSTANCNFTPQNCQELTEVRIEAQGAHERVAHLERWQAAQNGHLSKIDDRLDKFLWFLVGIFATSAGTLLVFIFTQFGVQPHP